MALGALRDIMVTGWWENGAQRGHGSAITNRQEPQGPRLPYPHP